MSCHNHEEQVGEYPAESLEWEGQPASELLAEIASVDLSRVRVLALEAEFDEAWK